MDFEDSLNDSVSTIIVRAPIGVQPTRLWLEDRAQELLRAYLEAAFEDKRSLLKELDRIILHIHTELINESGSKAT